MKTFIVEEVLTDYYDGIMIVKAEDEEQAIEILLRKIKNDVEKKIYYVSPEDIVKVKCNMRELIDNEAIIIEGGM